MQSNNNNDTETKILQEVLDMLTLHFGSISSVGFNIWLH